MASPKRHNIIMSQTPVDSMTIHLFIILIYRYYRVFYLDENCIFCFICVFRAYPGFTVFISLISCPGVK